VMRRAAPTLSETAPFAEVVQHFLASDFPVCFVVDGQRRLLGTLIMQDVKAMVQEDSLGSLVIAKDLCHSPQATVRPDETLARCLGKFAASDQEYLAVVSSADELLGLISHRDILSLYNREILRHEYLSLSLRAEGIGGIAHEHVRLPQEYAVEILPVPYRYVGKTLRETQLRSHFNLTVVAIRRGGRNSHDEFPNADHPLAGHDHLVLVGRHPDVRRFAAEQETRDHY
jgi:hypothetical protein